MTSETASHTAGPWKAGRADMATLVDNVDSKYIYGPGEKPTPVAIAHGRASDDWAVIMANARLIAASPDLLKAAKRALSTFRAQGVHRDGNNVVAALEDAIALATQSKGA